MNVINNSILSFYSNTLKVYRNMKNINTEILKNNEAMELNYEIN